MAGNPELPAVKKQMTPLEMEICACVPGDLDQAGAIFQVTFAASADWIKEGVAKGFYQANTLKIDGVPVYVVIWHKNDQSLMVVNALAQLNGGGHFAGMIAAVKEIGRAAGCKAIEAMTARAALVRKAADFGFAPVGVTLICPL